MTADELKASVLQMAIEGRLVPQLDDEPAVDMDADSPDEVPFAIPEKWKWVTIQDVVEKLTDGEHKTPRYIQSGVPFISVKNISSGKLNFNNTKYISIDDYNIYKKRCNPEYGDLLLSKVGTTGVPAIVDTNKNFSLFVSVALLKLKKDIIYNKFIYNAIMSPIVQKQARENTRGVGNKNWVLSAIGKTVFPLPPLAEQRRIVEKLEEILPVIEEYGKAHDALQAEEKALPGKLRASLLQEAISGRLVPQRDDEPAVDIDVETPDDVPFAIPEKWKWVRINNIGKVASGATPKTGVAGYWSSKGIPWITPADLGKNKSKTISCGERFITQEGYDSCSVVILPKGTIVYSSRAPIGYLAIAENELTTNQGCKSVIPNTDIVDSEYVYYTLMALTPEIQSRASGTTFLEISGKKMGETLFPLPPLAEQRRIVIHLNDVLIHVSMMSSIE